MTNNYTPSYNQYRTQTAGYALPSSVRTYSVFDPASNTWRRMTNDGMSPMPQGNQQDIQAALAQARQTQGTVYPAQGMGQGQPVEMHPGYMNPPVKLLLRCLLEALYGLLLHLEEEGQYQYRDSLQMKL